MRNMLLAFAVIFLTSILSSAQTFNWQELKKPYFVYDSKGVSVGWFDDVQYTYLLATDLIDLRAYSTTEDGAESWEINGQPGPRIRIPVATRVSASRTYGGYAAAIFPLTTKADRITFYQIPG